MLVLLNFDPVRRESEENCRSSECSVGGGRGPAPQDDGAAWDDAGGLVALC